VTLTFSQTSVSADGLSVVKGEMETTEYGKPDGSVTVTLRPKLSETGEAAVTSGARVTICGSTGSMIWPTGSVVSPSATPVDVVTDTAGIYDFTMTVGTVPGTFPLNAQAENAAGVFITADLKDASPDETLTVTPPGNWTVDQFLSELDGLKSDAAASKVLAAMTNDPASITQTLSQLSSPGSKLGGLAYSLVAGGHGGYAVLIYPDTNPPEVSPTGEVVSNDQTLVLSPDDWVGTKLVPITTLNVVIQKGLLTAVPTFPQRATGAAVPG